jgi:hypothetical protein
MHHEDQQLEAGLHRRALALASELHMAEMEHEVELARRESVRDEWAQKAEWLQALLLLGTLNFSNAVAVFCEAPQPPGAGVAVTRLYSFLCAVAIAAAVVSLWTAVRTNSRTSRYAFQQPRAVYSCGKRHVEFADFHRCHCARLERASTLSLFVSFATTPLAAGLQWYLNFNATLADGGIYEAPAAAWLLLLATVVVAGFTIYFGWMHWKG